MEKVKLDIALKGFESMTFYCTLYGDVSLVSVEKDNTLFFKPPKAVAFQTDRYGVHKDYPDGECVVFPSKDKRDWANFLKLNLPEFSYVMAGDDVNDLCVRHYKGDGYCYTGGINASMDAQSLKWDYVIPFEQYNPNLSTEELKKLSIV
ncbi:MAG: hypothetical protein AB7G87_10010 [Clostridia bacterium]